MISINTNLTNMSLENSMRLNSNAFKISVGRLSNGSRITSAADDPSGLAISQGMKEQAHGISTAISNIQDNINLIHTADAGLSEIEDALIRVQNLAVNLCNTATHSANPKSSGAFPPNQSDSRNLKDEIATLVDGIRQLGVLTDFNGKGAAANLDPNNPVGILFGMFAAGLQTSQVGPDNDLQNRLAVTITSIANLATSINNTTNPLDPPPDADDQVWADFARNILADITETNALAPPGSAGLPSLANTRAELGVLENRMTHALNDLQAQYINVTAARSRIEDADFAQEITQMTANSIIAQSSQSVATQANSSPVMVSKLLGAIYDGMISGPFSSARR